jgi:hypothetical protein
VGDNNDMNQEGNADVTPPLENNNEPHEKENDSESPIGFNQHEEESSDAIVERIDYDNLQKEIVFPSEDDEQSRTWYITSSERNVRINKDLCKNYECLQDKVKEPSKPGIR